ncbi:MAG TPA: DedA family protein [Terriglobales bacterium]|nr:DedA family protein [Terriglobales bacterium]
MAQEALEFLRNLIVHYGYWGIAGALLLENAGIPVPGETILLLASFLAFSEHELSLPWIIVVGTCGATVGDNIGFALGHYGGRRLLDRYRKTFRISDALVERGERLFQRFGSVTIFFSRFIFGMRVIAGPLAGVLRMDWKNFALFNFLGALVWVTTISLVGYFFGRNWSVLAEELDQFQIAILIVAALAILVWWRFFGRPGSTRSR